MPYGLFTNRPNVSSRENTVSICLCQIAASSSHSPLRDASHNLQSVLSRFTCIDFAQDNETMDDGISDMLSAPTNNCNMSRVQTI